MLSCQDLFVKPSFLLLSYKTFAYTPATDQKKVLGLAGFDNEYPSQEDLMTFMALFRIDITAATFTSAPVNGGVSDLIQPSMRVTWPSSTGEPSVPVEYAVNFVSPVRRTRCAWS